MIAGWTHRRLGRLWKAQLRFHDGVFRLAAPALGLALPAAEHFVATPGRGIEALVDGHAVTAWSWVDGRHAATPTDRVMCDGVTTERSQPRPLRLNGAPRPRMFRDHFSRRGSATRSRSTPGWSGCSRSRACRGERC